MDSYNDIWELVRSYCREKVSETIYSLWLEPLELKSFEDDQVILSASDFKANIVRSKFKNLLDEAFENYMGFPIDVVIQSEGKSDDRTPKAEEAPKSTNHPMVNDELTFDTFVVGSSTTFAHAAALAVANAPGEAYNPLFIYGNSGLGKTHLLYAICDRIARDNPDAKILYTRGEDFTNELISSIQKQTTEEFQNKYRTVDVLLVDDVQFIAGKDRTQEEFFHTFNTLVPVYTNIDVTPEYLSGARDLVTTDYLYWSDRLIAALADAHYNDNLSAIENYQQTTLAFGHENIRMTDAELAAKGRDSAGMDDVEIHRALEAANQKECDFLKKQTDALLHSVLYTAAMHMKNGFFLSDN